MKRSVWSITAGLVLLAVAIGAVLFVLYAARLQSDIRARFEGKRWSLPAVVYARPLELYAGQQLSAQMLEDELLLSGYRPETEARGEGSYSRKGNSIQLVSRSFHFPSGFEASQKVNLTFSGNTIASLKNANGEALDLLRLDPARIGSFHPTAHEDRIVIDYEEIPRILIDTLLAIEDQHFFTHSGVAPLAILRALIVNIRAGDTVQGGSTITQQLVKNLFLTHERTASRKAKEAIMALILDYHYSKKEILTTYINEVFLGQDGNRAIHGFALASQYYFHRALADLSAAQIATLVGMVKGPSLYDPQRNPEKSRERRQVILQRMADLQMIDQGQLREASKLPVIDVQLQKGGFNRFPAFLDLVRQQLVLEYQEEDLKTNGLQILTTLDPRVQFQMERDVREAVPQLEKQFKQENIEAAMIITNRDNGEILAMAGGKTPVQKGFNRVLQARRPIGSLIKPVVYLSALEQGYTLASPLQDTAVSYIGEDRKEWAPQNYDRKEHGQVALFHALAHSYNLATVRLGMDLGLETIVTALQRMGFSRQVEALPSLLLGAVDMTPFEVAQMYQTLAADGFYTPLRAINSVMAADHSVLSRYGISVEQRFTPETVYLLNHALQRVGSEGTARSIRNTSLRDHQLAGKTGTTNDMRDSWFAGFSGDHLAVTWLGHDDNSPVGMTGATGALPVWSRVLADVQTAPLNLTEPEGIIWRRIDRFSLEETSEQGEWTALLPFVAGHQNALPQRRSEHSQFERKNSSKNSLLDTIKGWLE